MSELLRDEKLTTADIVSPPRTEFDNRAAAEDGVSTRADMRNDLRTDPAYRQSDGKDQSQPNPLFPEDELHNFRSRWDQVQTSFVDEPRAAVEHADSLVANVVKRIAEQFASEREQLEKQWDRGENVNTEDLRQAFKRYRAFFDRLLSV
ncbi:MAG TPA: hypothetical protein VL498_00515 [Terracidiphilus sp.]|jgi:hypothetical protein|nr:hypothetical protein [Terracidiphilus sp.]